MINITPMQPKNKISTDLASTKLSVWDLYSQDASNPDIMKIVIALDYGLLPTFNLPKDELDIKLKSLDDLSE